MRRIEPTGVVCLDLQDLPDEMWGEFEDCAAAEQTVPRRRIIGDWAKEVPGLLEELGNVLAPRLLDATRIEVLEREVILVKERCTTLENRQPVLVPIASLAPEPYDVVKPFHAVVQLHEHEYIATFFDANISASGDTQAEAILNLKDVLLGALEILAVRDEKDLGAGSLHQKRVLGEFIRKRA